MMGSFSKYPACVAAQQAGTSLDSVNVAVHASMNEATINESAAIRLAFGVGLWSALVIHICGVELYVCFTFTAANFSKCVDKRLLDSFDREAKSTSRGIYPYKSKSHS